MVALPSKIFEVYNSICDDMIIDNFGVNCTLEYPNREESCANCIYDSINRCSSNHYKAGGPMPFNLGICPFCNGEGLLSISVEETIKMRVYFNRKDWIKVGIPVNIPDAAAMSIGFMADLPKVKQAERFILSDLAAMNKWEYILEGEPQPWGFKRNRYFVAFWRKA